MCRLQKTIDWTYINKLGGPDRTAKQDLFAIKMLFGGLSVEFLAFIDGGAKKVAKILEKIVRNLE